MDEERIAENDFAWAGCTVSSGGLVAQHDARLHIAKAARSGNGVELRTDLELPRRLDRVAMDCHKVASTGRKQGRQEVAIVAEEFDNRVGDGDIFST